MRLNAYSVFAFLTALPFSLSAATYTWNSTSSADWNTAGNWSPNTGPPGAGDTAIFPNPTPGGLVTAITYAVNTTVGSIEFNGGTYSITDLSLARLTFNNSGSDSTIQIASGVTGSPTITSALHVAFQNNLDIQNSSTFDLIANPSLFGSGSPTLNLTAGTVQSTLSNATLDLSSGTTFTPNPAGIEFTGSLDGSGTFVLSDGMGNAITEMFLSSSTFSGTLSGLGNNSLIINTDDGTTVDFSSATINVPSTVSFSLGDGGAGTNFIIDSATSFPNASPAIGLTGSSVLEAAGSTPFSYAGNIEFNGTATASINVPQTVFTQTGNLHINSFFKTGNGTLVVSGTNSLTSTSTISAGTVIVTTAFNSIDVTSGATLGGTGTITTASVAAGGILSPGSSSATLTIGTLTLDASTYQVELSPYTASLLNITGSAALGSGTSNVSLFVNSGSYPGRNSLPILNGSYSGSFNPDITVMGSPGNLVFSLDQNDPNFPNQILLNWTTPLAWVGTTSDWNTASNWSPAQVPVADDTANFSGSGVMDVTFSAPVTVGSINFTGGSYSIAGTANFTFSNSAGTGVPADSVITISSGVGGNQSISAGTHSIVLENNLDIENTSGFSLALSSVTGAFNLNVTGELLLSSFNGDLLNIEAGGTVSPNAANGQITMTGLTGSGVLQMTGIGGNNYSGGLTSNLNGNETFTGTLSSSSSYTFTTEGSGNQIFTGATIDVPTGFAIDITGNSHFTFDSTVSFSNGLPTIGIAGSCALQAAGSTNFSYGGDIDLSGTGSAVLDRTGSATFTTTGSITDKTMSGVTFEKTGPGTLLISCPCTYTGPTVVSEGTLALNSSASLASPTIFLSNFSVILQATGSAPVSYGGSIDISGFTFEDSAISVDPGVVFTVTGPITNMAMDFVPLTKRGEGTLVLTGASTYDGPTEIIQGTLAINSTASFASSQFEIYNSATFGATGSTPFTFDLPVSLLLFSSSNVDSSMVSVDPGLVFTISSPITDPNMDNVTFEKVGSGTLVLSGASTYDGATMVSAGRLNVTGAIGSSNTTTVASGATLGGTGNIAGPVTIESGGFLTPGTSIGTLTVGSLILDPGSITQIEINPTTSSQISVQGATALAGSVQVLVDSGSYAAMGQDVILTTTSDYTGSFSSVFSTNPDFTFTLDQTNPMQVTLNWIFAPPPPPPPVSKISTAGLTGNANKFARYLNHNVPNSSATQALAKLSGEVLQKALESADPARNGFAPFAIQNTLFGLSGLVSGHLVEQRLYYAPKMYGPIADGSQIDETYFTAAGSNAMFCPPRPSCRPSHSVWAGAIGEYAFQGKLDQNPSFHFLSGGALIGVDFYNEWNLFGFSGGAAYTHLIQKENGGSAKINYYFANLYDTCYSSSPCRPFYVEWAIWGVYNQIHNYRNISFPGFQGTASATFHSWELAPHFGLGYQASYCGFEWEPFALFDLVIDWQEGFKEHGVGAFDMTHESRTSFFLRSEGGLRFYKIKQFDWGSWIAIAKGSYVNKKAFGTGSIAASIVGTSALFSVETFRGVQNLGSFGFEMVWRKGHVKPVSFSIAYDGEWGMQYWSQAGMIRLAKDF